MSEDDAKTATLEFDGFTLHARRRLLEKDGQPIRLTPRVFDLLAYLVARAGDAVTKEELLDKVWSDAVVEEGNINRTVSTLRKQLGRQTDGRDFIETIPRTGYRFVADVRVVETDVVSRNGSDPSRDIRELSPQPARPYLVPAALLLAFIAVVAAGVIVYRSMGATPPVAEKNVPIKLLESPDEEFNPSFTADGRVRFARRVANKEIEPRIVNADGTADTLSREISELTVGHWSPDGSRVFFHRASAPRKIFLANADGSNEQEMPFSPGNATWSPDGKYFLYQAKAVSSDVPNDSDLFMYELETGVIKTAVEGPSFDGDPGFSPDGASIVFVSDRDGNFEIYRKHLGTGEIVRLTNDAGHDSFPTYSPDGTEIIFNSDREKENTDVYLMRADGEDVRKITEAPGWDAAPPNCWSPDGTRILLLSDRDGDEDIYVINIEPSAPRLVVDVGSSSATSPSYSPDGGTILYARQLPDETSELNIFDIASKTSRVVIGSRASDAHATFSPDGRRILFQDRIDDNSEICLVNIDGTGHVNLTQNPSRDTAASFSSDGKLIAFSSSRAGSLSLQEIYLMNPDGTDQRMLFGDRAISTLPAFSPDGRFVVFANDREGGRVGNFELFKVALDGSGETRITNRKRIDSNPAYSPDGSRIAFSSNTDGNHEIYIVNVDGSGLLRLTRDTADDLQPRWSPDGTRIIFTSNRGGTFGVYEIEL